MKVMSVVEPWEQDGGNAHPVDVQVFISSAVLRCMHCCKFHIAGRLTGCKWAV